VLARGRRPRKEKRLSGCSKGLNGLQGFIDAPPPPLLLLLLGTSRADRIARPLARLSPTRCLTRLPHRSIACNLACSTADPEQGGPGEEASLSLLPAHARTLAHSAARPVPCVCVCDHCCLARGSGVGASRASPPHSTRRYTLRTRRSGSISLLLSRVCWPRFVRCCVHPSTLARRAHALSASASCKLAPCIQAASSLANNVASAASMAWPSRSRHAYKLLQLTAAAPHSHTTSSCSRSRALGSYSTWT